MRIIFVIIITFLICFNLHAQVDEDWFNTEKRYVNTKERYGKSLDLLTFEYGQDSEELFNRISFNLFSPYHRAITSDNFPFVLDFHVSYLKWNRYWIPGQLFSQDESIGYEHNWFGAGLGAGIRFIRLDPLFVFFDYEYSYGLNIINYNIDLEDENSLATKSAQKLISTYNVLSCENLVNTTGYSNYTVGIGLNALYDFLGVKVAYSRSNFELGNFNSLYISVFMSLN